MATCELCFDLKHWKCRDRDCTCSVCARKRVSEKPTRTRAKKEPKERKPPKPRASKPYVPVSTARTEAKKKFGVLTDFTPDQVQFIYERKEAGGPEGSISAIAKALGTSRDRVRTIYRSPRAPSGACIHCGEDAAALRSEIEHLRQEVDRWKGASFYDS